MVGTEGHGRRDAQSEITDFQEFDLVQHPRR